MMKLAIIILSVSLVSSLVGIKVGFSQSILSTFVQKSLDYYSDVIPNYVLFAYSNQEVGEGVFKVSLNLTEPRIYNIKFNLAQTGINITDNDSFSIKADSLNMLIEFDWVYKSVLTTGTGTGYMNIIRSNFFENIQSNNLNGYLSFESTSEDFVIDSFSLTFEGSSTASTFNRLSVLFKDTIQSLFQNGVKNYLGTTFISNLNDELRSYNQMYNFTDNVGLSFLVDNYTSSPYAYADVGFTGVFVNPNSPNYSPVVTGNSVIPHFNQNLLDIQISVSEYSLNTLGYTMFKNNFFSRTIDSSNLPASSKIKLDTTSLNYLLPGITIYGQNQPCQLIINAVQTPVIRTIGPTGTSTSGYIEIAVNVTLNVYVISAKQTAVIFGGVLSANGTVSVNKWYLDGNIGTINLVNTTVTKSNIGDNINVEGMTDFTNIVVRAVLPTFNEEIFGNGYQLPSPKYTTMTNSSASIQTGYIYVLATPTFQFPVLKSLDH